MQAQQTDRAQKPAAERITEITRLLRDEYPDAHCELHYQSPLQLLVATILSAQCTDERVNKVTPVLFERYPTALAFAEADISELEALIRSTGFYRNKAKNIQAACRRIIQEYGGEVPSTMEELLTLKGVARKTANVVLGNAFQTASGIAVDTHVKRLSNRLHLTKHDKPEKIEQDLMKLVPEADWIDISHLLIFHGRRVCDARVPNCPMCTLKHLCPSANFD